MDGGIGAGAAAPILLFSGKGGVGKTTLAAATALVLAGGGASTLLVSTDPAHSTGDLLGRALGDRPEPVSDRLWALEVDPQQAAAAHVARVRATVQGSVDPELLPAVERHLALARDSPGTVEAAMLDRMGELLAACPGRYERLVFDTAPSGHTLRLLALPELLSAWVEGLMRQRERVAGMDRMLANMVGQDPAAGVDPLLERLRERRGVLRTTARRLREDAVIWLVCTPERLAIEETDRTASALRGAGLTVAGLILNRVLPEDADGAFLAERRAQEALYLREVGERFEGQRLVTVHQQRRDVVTREQLGVLAGRLRAEGVV